MRRIAKVVRKVKIGEQESDLAYWRRQSYRARINALEEIRREYHLWKYGGEPKFVRVVRIVKQKR